MSNRFVLNRKGVRELLVSPEMADVIGEFTDKALARAGGASAGYAANVMTHHRAVGRVYAYNSKGMRDNNESNTLLKALGND